MTGASRGIGRTIAELLAAEGARVVCVARTLNEGDHRLEGSLDSTVAAIRGRRRRGGGGRGRHLVGGRCLELVEAARAAYGPIDTLVNNAALNYYIPTADVSDQPLDQGASRSTSTRRSSCRRRCCRT